MRVKICGVTRAEDVLACKDAAYIGLNFFPKSPRSVTPDQAAALAVDIPVGQCKVALVVDPDDALLDQLMSEVPLDMIQLHGRETPERVAEVKARYGLPVMKAIGIADQPDLQKITDFGAVADQLLIDAKPPKDAVLLGGNGVPFDWRLIAGRKWPVPWMLAGGLTAENVRDAVRLTGATQVDLASAVESSPGIKDAAKIDAFITAASAAG